MMKNTIILLIIIGTTIASYSQSLKINLKGDWPNETITEVSYSRYVKEYVITKSNEKLIEVNIPDSIVQAILQIKVLQKNQELFSKKIIWEDKSLEIRLEGSSSKIQATWLQDSTNLIYEKFTKKRDSLQNRIKTLQEITRFYSDTTGGFYKKVENERDRELFNLETVYNQFYENSTGKFVENFIKVSKLSMPNNKSSRLDQSQDIQKDFFLYFDPMQPAVVNSYLYKDKLNEYLWLILEIANESKSINENIVNHYLDQFLIKIINNEEALIETSEYIRNYMHRKGLDKVEAYIDVNYIATVCSAEDNIDLQRRLENYNRLAIGKIAPEIEGITNEDQFVKLSKIESDFTVILFWASWCGHCKESLPKIYDYLSSRQSTTVIAIGLDADKISWEQEIKNYISWKHLRGVLQWEDPIAINYAVYATPTIFILDKNKKILGKCKDLVEIKNIL